MDDKNVTIFEESKSSIQNLLNGIEYGSYRLPDLQRPFVWTNSKIRDLFDSMYRGFPIGFFLFWHNPSVDADKVKSIGDNQKATVHPDFLIIDGQQRLTALFAVMKGVRVYDKTYAYRDIRIAFNPVIEKFDVANAATSQNHEWIESITDVFKNGSFAFINDYISRLKTYRETVDARVGQLRQTLGTGKRMAGKDKEFLISRLNTMTDPSEDAREAILKARDGITLSPHEDDLIQQVLNFSVHYNEPDIAERISRLAQLVNYPYQALVINTSVEDEVVADIFTRINSKGTKLNQGDFILTLTSVFWEEGRRIIDDFCAQAKTAPGRNAKPSSFNRVFEPDPQDIIRVVGALGFKRARMRELYAILKGRDPVSRKFSEELRIAQFERIQRILPVVVDNMNWHNFLKVIEGLGFKGKELVSSKMALTYAYAFYLIGKIDHGLDEDSLRKCIGKWFFFINLTSRYSSSPESTMESDLNHIKACQTSPEYISYIENTVNTSLTADFWDITLPKDILISASPTHPVANAFYAIQIFENDYALFSDHKIADLFDPSKRIKKSSLDKHHLFPLNHLKKRLGIKERHKINQIANLTYIEYHRNIKIKDGDPKDYMQQVRAMYQGREDELVNNLISHCIPENFQDIDYDDFLEKRRALIAKRIRVFFNKRFTTR
jgi:uncharacterized protein with ParB-like and HNH nuclease domain